MKSGLNYLYDNLLQGSIGMSSKDATLSLAPGTESFKIAINDGNVVATGKNGQADDQASALNSEFEAFKKDLTTVQVASSSAGCESFTLTDAQKAAGFLGSKYGVINKSQAESGTYKLFNGATNEIPSIGLNSVMSSADVLSTGDGTSLNLSELGIGTEAYDVSLNMNAQHFATFINIGLAKQEDLAEMFFPTVVIAPEETGVKALVKLTSFVQEYRREINDKRSPLEKMDPHSIIKNIFNRDILGEDRTKVVPVFRAEFQDKLLKTVQNVSKITGEEFTTSPYLFGFNNDIIQMSQTDRQLAEGVMDGTDALLGQITLSKLYFSFEGNGSAKQMFGVDVSRQAGANFGFIGAGHWKDLTLRFSNRPITIKLGAAGTKLWDQSAQDLTGTTTTIDGLLAGKNIENFSITFAVTVSGSANIEQGTVEAFGSKIEVAHIFDDAGKELDLTQGLGKAFVDFFKTQKLQLEGYELDAYRSNTNLRTKGRTIKVDEYGVYFVAPWRTPFNVLGPISRHTGSECDFDHVQSLVTAITAASDVHAIMELEKFSDALRLRSEDPQAIAGLYDYSMNGQLVNTYFQEKTMNLTDHVDSIMSHQRMLDVQASMINELRLSCLNMLIESNYLLAFNVLYKGSGKKPIVLIGCDPVVKEFLLFGQTEDKIPGTNFDIVVVSTLNPAMKDKMYITLTLGEKVGDVTSIQALNFGWRLFSVAVTATINPENRGNSASVRTIVIPRYFHQADLPIMMVYTVKGLPEVIKKIPVLTK